MTLKHLYATFLVSTEDTLLAHFPSVFQNQVSYLKPEIVSNFKKHITAWCLIKLSHLFMNSLLWLDCKHLHGVILALDSKEHFILVSTNSWNKHVSFQIKLLELHS